MNSWLRATGRFSYRAGTLASGFKRGEQRHGASRSAVRIAPRRLAARVFLVRSGPEFVAVICARRPGAADAGSGPDLLGRDTVAGVCLHFHLERPARLVQAQWLAAAAHDVKTAVFRPRGWVTRFPVKVRRRLRGHLVSDLDRARPIARRDIV